MNKYKRRAVIRLAVRVLLFQLVFGFMGLMLVPLVLQSNSMLRLVLSGVLILLGILFVFSQGAIQGERHCALSERLNKSIAVRNYHPSEEEDAGRYDWRKGVWGALVGGAPILILALLLAITTRPYAYTLQSYPTWLSTYSSLPELGDALSYMENIKTSLSIDDITRIAVRFMLFPFIGIVGEMSNEMSLLFDRLTPLMAMLLPVCFMLGYLQGPSHRAKESAAIEAAKKQPKKRLTKEAKKRLSQRREPQKKDLI